MLKKLFDFKVSKQMKIAKIILILGILAAIVVTAFGLVEIMDMTAMKAHLGVTRLIMGDVALFLLKNYLVWALLILLAATVCYYVMRHNDRKAQAAA